MSTLAFSRARAPMGPRRRWHPARLLVCLAIVSSVLATAVVVQRVSLADPPPQTAEASLAVFRPVSLTMSDGVELQGNLFSPVGPRGNLPLIVMPSVWSGPDILYVARALEFASRGYLVLSYTVRGFWLSGGEVTTAGPRDVADISEVIDWALANAPADPDRIGMTGVSLGGAMSLLGGAFDARVKAVASMSGWADLNDALASGQTRHLQSVNVLNLVGSLTGRLSDEQRQTIKDFNANRNAQGLIDYAAVRSPQSFLARFNSNGTAVLVANTWDDSIINPNQLIRFFEGLSTPKRLQFRPGDHATAELTGLLGLPNDVWTDVERWLDHHVKGDANGVDQEQPVEILPQGQLAYEAYPDWSAVATSTLDLGLGGPGPFGPGTLRASGPTAGWSTSIVGGMDSGADGGIVLLSGLLDQFVQLPPIVNVNLIDPSYGSVFVSQPYAGGARIRGSARLHTTVTASASDGTVIAYLYDVDEWGNGRLVAHAPQSFLGTVPGTPTPFDVDLYASAYDVPAGHRLALVLDTADPLYGSVTPAFSSVSFSSPANDPSHLTVPVR